MKRVWKTAKILALVCLYLPVNAQHNPEKAVLQAVEALRQAMETPDSAKLYGLTAASLSYGHSNGVIEDRSAFVQSLMTGKYRFLRIDLSHQQVIADKELAIVRHQLRAHTHDQGKPEADILLGVMLVWRKQQGSWQLVARQAFKL